MLHCNWEPLLYILCDQIFKPQKSLQTNVCICRGQISASADDIWRKDNHRRHECSSYKQPAP